MDLSNLRPRTRAWLLLAAAVLILGQLALVAWLMLWLTQPKLPVDQHALAIALLKAPPVPLTELEVPVQWELEEIAKKVSPGPGTIYVLAWRIETDGKSFYGGGCLVLTEWRAADGSTKWSLANLVRDPANPGNPWQIPIYHVLEDIEGIHEPAGRWVHELEAYDKLPSNKEINAFCEKHRRFLGNSSVPGIQSKVCTKTWEKVIGEKPPPSFSY